jgi:uncharacterized membrane protein YecN with MAPEG domain
MPRIVPFYASLLAALYIFLSLRVIRMRRRDRIALGDGNNRRLQRAVRVHANFAEYVPLALILAAFVELQQSSPLIIHLMCLALIMGRVVHAYGVSQEKEDYRLRVVGMALTFGAIATSALRLLGSFLFGF